MSDYLEFRGKCKEPGPLHGTAVGTWTPTSAGEWTCTANYAGDTQQSGGEYGPSTAQDSYDITAK